MRYLVYLFLLNKSILLTNLKIRNLYLHGLLKFEEIFNSSSIFFFFFLNMQLIGRVFDLCSQIKTSECTGPGPGHSETELSSPGICTRLAALLPTRDHAVCPL